MTHHTPAHPARQHWLSVGGSNYSDKDHFPDIGTTQYSLALLITNTTTLAYKSTLATSYQILQRSLVTSYQLKELVQGRCFPFSSHNS
jgi:hypothetical protein